MSAVTLEYLFPAPSLPKSSLSPSHFPGISPQSTQTLQEVLKDNHVKWHVFFNEKRFHNHAAHRAIAAWALGAEPSAISSGYKKDCGYEKPAVKSPQAITTANFDDHLGNEEYYSGYVQFFTDCVKEHGISHALEQFIFSPKANIGTGSKQPWMLSRFLSGVLHPMIHAGYGAEFELPGMVVEGLAMTAVHKCPDDLLTHLGLFDDKGDTLHHLAHNASETIQSVFSTTTSIADKVLPSNLQMNTSGLPRTTEPERPSSDCLTILSRVLHDPRFAASKESENPFDDTLRMHGTALAALTNQWALNPATIDAHIEELAWAVCVLYGVAGWTDAAAPHGFTADFFLMHLVTSSIFLPALCAHLPAGAQLRLLKAYLHVMLVWAVARGQPALDVAGFARAMQRPAADVPPSVAAMKHLDLWMRVIEEAQTHHDEHVTKTIRSLAGWAAAFGSRKPRATPAERTNDDEKERGKDACGLGVSHDEAESAGLGMGLGEGNEVWISRNGQEGGPDAELEANKQGEDADLNPRAWRDSKNGGDEDMTGFQPRPSDDDDSDLVLRTELPGSDFLDGNLFQRVAILTLGRMGWDTEGGEKKPPNREKTDHGERDDEFWDFKGFFDKTEKRELDEGVATKQAPKAKF